MKLLRLPLATVARWVARAQAPLALKLQAGLLLVIAMVIATGFLSVSAFRRIERQAVELEQLHSAVTLAQAELDRSIVVQEGLSSMLVLTGDASYHAKLIAERRRFRQALAQLATHEVAKADVRRIAEVFARYEQASEAVAKTKRQGLDHYAQDLHTTLERVIAHEIETSTGALVSGIQGHRQAELARILWDQHRTKWIVGGSFLLSIVLALALASLIARSIVHPIRRVDATLERIARGEFTTVTDVANRDELGSLVAHLNRMSRQLAELYTKEREAARKLHEQFESLRRTQAQLVQAEKLRALGEMAGGVAHDFNNLLTVVLGQAQVLLKKGTDGAVGAAELERRLGVVEQAALDGANTVRRLLEFTRARPRLHEFEPILVGDLFASALAAAQPRWKDEANAQGRQIEVVTDFREVPPILGNPAELREVLLNLIFNALDAMPEGGRLGLRAWRDGDAVCLAVGDTGVGMPEEVASRVFEPFFTTKGPLSSGLGLSVSYGIVRRHQGELRVASRPGQGSTFTIRLPASSVPVTPVERAAPSPPPRAVPLQVLIVDDETQVREVLEDVFVEGGHRVSAASSGREALEMLETMTVDLVCTDLGMPGMTGWQLADHIKLRWPELKVALITGWGARIEPEELAVHGVDFLIAKPFQAKELHELLAEVGLSRA